MDEKNLLGMIEMRPPFTTDRYEKIYGMRVRTRYLQNVSRWS